MALYPIQDAFIRGEISPRLHARASLDLYQAALSLCENFVTLPHGGLRKRGGTYFVGEVKDSADVTRLIPFIFSADQAYALELGDLYLRVYAYGARVGTVEVTTPWSSADLADIKFVQSADVMWLVHPSYRPQKLTRTAHTSWALEVLDFTDGPFAAVNTEETEKMYVSAATGSITVTADFSAFDATMVGQLIRIDMESYENIKPWEPVQVVTGSSSPLGELRRYNGNVYECMTSDYPGANFHRTGSTPPTHLKGTEWDGPGTFENFTAADAPDYWTGLEWQYLHSGYGVARITAYTSPTEVSATVITEFPEEVVGSGNASYLWRLGAFGIDNYPDSVTLFEERLVFGAGSTVYASKTGDFDSFRLGEQDDDALQFLQAGGGQANGIEWLAESEGSLVLGTIGGVRSLSGSGLDEALTPSSFKNRKSKTAGTSNISPIETGVSFIYATRGDIALAELTLNSVGRFNSSDLAQISEHIPKKGIRTIAYQEQPDPFVWFPLDNGHLGCMTYQPAQEVRGMHRHVTGGYHSDATGWAVVEDCIVTPGQAGEDDVWLIVRRTNAGVTKRFIEMLTTSFEYGDLADAFQVDAGLSYSGAATNTVSGMTHLAGRLVDVLADGVVYRDLTVSGGGVVTLPASATAAEWHVGLRFEAAASTLELDVGSKDGSLLGRRKRVKEVILSLFETDTSGLEISSLISGAWETADVPGVDDAAASLFTGNVRVRIDDSWSGQGRISIRHDAPTPCTIRAIVPVFEAEP
jgi:hypothetical protein